MNEPEPEKPFAFDFGDDGPSLKAAVFQALGAASVCWESMAGTGIFDDRRAVEIGNALLDFIRDTTDPKPAPKANPSAYLVPINQETR